MNAIESIAKSLASFFAEQDAKIADRDVEWALKTAAALRAFRQTEEFAALNAKGAWGGVYPRMFEICGGKTWYNVFSGNGQSGIEAFMRNNAKAVAEKRNAKIAAQLAKAGVETVESAEVVHTNDGFQGVFAVNGDRRVFIDVILAGGHNIQRLHQRVLVKVK